MPVTVVCDKCGKQLRIADEQVGKRAKCPKCKEVIVLQPASEAASAAQGGAAKTASSGVATSGARAAGGSSKTGGPKGDWFVLTADQQEFGPIARSELDLWIKEGRIDSQCQLLQDGWEQWRWADEIYPELAAAANPPAPVGGAVGFSVSTASGPVAAVGGTNPYTSPQVTSTPTVSGGASMDPNAQLPLQVITPLRNTSTWILVFVVLGGIALLFSSLGTLAMLGLALASGQMSAVLSSLFFAAPGLVVTGLFTYLLYNYWNSIGVFSRMPNFPNLQKALEAQQVYWQMAAIAVLIMIGINILGVAIMFALMGALFSAAGSMGGPPPRFGPP